ncbi:PilZ domain-containing protein [Stutzerimonas nosocomialis]|uniref:PilZ domain-containing protein n=1 Tax=Stutzerimonas nosocomialis TaxID=1056496 RepID=A0A5R9QA14_9GAMM|nr:PilZ domain-containing protein [Stutzerimonas nosocomialis]TLX60568.1 PilZ domain-containing protein [Stutzerimonas nosocomialis]TLX61728.1 PilZ domain-containing protein [Stutzerimonas nosocomialis]
MSTRDNEERREYYRIEDRVALEIVPLPREQAAEDDPAGDAPPLFNLLSELHRLDFEAQHLLRQIGETNRPLVNYLKVQNRRIDLIGQALAQDLLKDLGETRSVELSEGGLRFGHAQPIPEGGRLLLKMVLMPQAMGLALQARVLYCQAREDGQYEIGTEFEALTDAQRQLLARHILKKQAQQRRLARELPERI